MAANSVGRRPTTLNSFGLRPHIPDLDADRNGTSPCGPVGAPWGFIRVVRVAYSFYGTTATIKAKLAPLIEATGADELMVAAAIWDHQARVAA
jgi:hypothetical protein